MSVERHLVAFDVDAIKEYVFAAVRPLDITGASRLVESFTQEAARKPGAVYAGGGNGILVRESAHEAEQLCEELEASFAKLTGDAGSCTAVTVPQGDDFRAARQRLWRELERRKATRALDEPSRELVPGGVRCCQACGREPGFPLEGRDDDPNEEKYLGRQCELRRKAGRVDRAGAHRDEPAPVRRDLSELFTDPGEAGSEPEQDEGRGQALAAVYLDADRAGERLRTLGGMKEVKAFAESVRSVTRAALHEAIRKLGLEGRFIAPVVGGDDVLVFIDAAQAGKMVTELWQRLRPLEQRWRLRFSGAVAVAPPRAPLRLLLRQVEVDLHVAKQAASAASAGNSPALRSEPAVVVTSLLGGRLHDSRSPLFGAPVPQSLWGGSPSVLELVEALADVASSQRAGMAEDLAQPSQELAALDLEYRAVAGRRSSAPSRNGRRDGREVQRALMAGQRLTTALQATCPEVSLAKVLLGGLAATEWWGRRG